MDQTTLEQISQEYAAADPEQRLSLLRSELLRPILTVQGVALLLKQHDADLAARLPADISSQEFEHLIQWLVDAGLELKQIVDTLAPGIPEEP